MTRGEEHALSVVDSSTLAIQDKDALTYFTFDHVCPAETTQEEIFALAGKDTLADLFQGINGTILAYGQTGAGKSHTMFGTELHAGLIPRVAEDIFTHISQGSLDIEYTVCISIMEIYKEHIYDLLTPESDDKDFVVQQDPLNGVYVKGLSHAFVSSALEMREIFHQGFQIRRKAPTMANVSSSRSHAIFQVSLSQKNTVIGEIKRSNLFLVDLAGSEKLERSVSSGNTLDETKKINKSLSTLGLVINTLTDPRATHIPYRDSKLTRILQESLGGNSRTTLIINVSPGLDSVSETFSTLRFGSRAKKIQNNVHVNKELSLEQLKARVAALEKANLQLENELRLRNNGVHTSASSSPASPRIISPTQASSLGMRNMVVSDLEDMQRKDAKIAELEQAILELKMEKLKTDHVEDLKLFKLESSLHRINEKLQDVELMNENLKRHLIISEKIIVARDDKINKLSAIVSEQQSQVTRESAQFEAKLRILKSKLDAQKFREMSKSGDEDSAASTLESFNHRVTSPAVTHSVDSTEEEITPQYLPLREEPSLHMSPVSPKIGLNLRIVKPLRGGKKPISEGL